jgi:hypothetical protein
MASHPAQATLAHRLLSWRSVPRLGRRLQVGFICLAALLALLIGIRLLLDPIAEWQTRKALAGLEGYAGTVRHVHVTLFEPGVEITDLSLWPDSRPSRSQEDKQGQAAEAAPHPPREPMLYIEKTFAELSWGQILHGRLLARLRLENPKLVIVPAAAAPVPAGTKPAARAPDLSTALEKVVGMKVDRVEIFDGELLFREAGGGAHPEELWIHRLELAAQNLATRPSLAGGRPATVAGHAVVGHTGELTLFVSADPFASPLSFAGQVSLKGLAASELYRFVEPKSGLNPAHGTIDVFAEFVSQAGLINGGIKPLLKNIEIRPTEAGVWNRMKAWLADKTVELGSDRVGDRRAIATTIPIKGKLTSPDLQLWPTVLGVIRNAFVRGVTSGFENLPPETAPRPEGPVEQAIKAVKTGSGPPKAQPVGP